MGFLDRILRRRTQEETEPVSPAQTEPDAPALDAEELAHLTASLWERAQAAFLTTTAPFERHDHLATDIASEGFPLDRAREILRQAWDHRARLAAEHAAEDQSAALRRAFAALGADGVLALEDCGFDNNEGHDIATEEARADGAPGYVFFHAQDAARLIDGPATLHLRFAASRYESTTAEGKSDEDEVIGRQVVAALEAEGLPVTWDGTSESTITIEGMRWFAAPGPQP